MTLYWELAVNVLSPPVKGLASAPPSASSSSSSSSCRDGVPFECLIVKHFCLLESYLVWHVLQRLAYLAGRSLASEYVCRRVIDWHLLWRWWTLTRRPGRRYYRTKLVGLSCQRRSFEQLFFDNMKGFKTMAQAIKYRTDLPSLQQACDVISRQQPSTSQLYGMLYGIFDAFCMLSSRGPGHSRVRQDLLYVWGSSPTCREEFHLSSSSAWRLQGALMRV